MRACLCSGNPGAVTGAKTKQKDMISMVVFLILSRTNAGQKPVIDNKIKKCYTTVRIYRKA